MSVERPDGRRDHSQVPSIRDLIREALDTGKTVRDLQADSGELVRFQTFQELSRHDPKQFPKDLKTFTGMSAALRVPETTVVLAYAKSIGVDISGASPFALRLPPGVDGLDPDVQDAVVRLIRALLRQPASRSYADIAPRWRDKPQPHKGRSAPKRA